MLETKLIKTLRTLHRRELTELNAFAQSGIVPLSEKALALLQLILTCSPAFSSPQLKKEAVFRKLFKKEPYNDTKIRLLQSDILKTVHFFIGIRMAAAIPFELEMLQLEHFMKVENNELTYRRIAELEKKVEAMAIHNEHYFHLRFRLEQLKSNYNAKRSKDYTLKHLFKNLEAYYFLNKLKMTCVRLSNNFIYRHETDNFFISEIRESLAKKAFPDNPVILGYSYCVLLLNDESPDTQFSNLYELLHHHKKQLGAHEVETFSKILENHCIRQINTGRDDFYEILFRLLETRLLDAVEITSGEVKTFMTLCLRMGKTAFAQQFITGKKDCIIPEEIRDDAFNYSMALLHFYKKEYDRVLLLLQQVEYHNVFYKIDSRKLLIQVFYDLKEWDSLDSAMNAFRVFIHRNAEISEVHKKNNQNFINFLYKMTHTGGHEQKRLLRLKHDLTKSMHLAERKWLLERLEERIRR